MWKDWLALSKREQKGFIVLSTLLFLLIVFYFSIPFIFHPDDTAVKDDLLQAWIDSTKKLNHPSEITDGSLFYFDPNTIKISELEKLGVRGNALITWLKFRESGKRFNVPADILQIRSIDPVLADTLIKYAVINTGKTQQKNVHHKSGSTQTIDHKNIPQSKETSLSKKKDDLSEPSFVIELNSADTADFAQIKGIGRVLSARIVAYRKALGGYYSADQLKEVYGMPQETIERNMEHFTVDTSLIKKININKASLRKLKAHPYIGFYLAKAIVEYRKNNYPIKSVNEVLLLQEAKKQTGQNLSKYLTVK